MDTELSDLVMASVSYPAGEVQHLSKSLEHVL